jgi:hypothetical protein
MLARLKSWIQGSRQRKLERSEAEQANLSEQHKHVILAGPEHFDYPSKGFDESSRGRPRK